MHDWNALLYGEALFTWKNLVKALSASGCLGMHESHYVTAIVYLQFEKEKEKKNYTVRHSGSL